MRGKNTDKQRKARVEINRIKGEKHVRTQQQQASKECTAVIDNVYVCSARLDDDRKSGKEENSSEVGSVHGRKGRKGKIREGKDGRGERERDVTLSTPDRSH
mmetsp:Transcript_25894/g.65596  ORF Transcript_25894/g.65596 Transcript_25894/m.65596 type:complete len:102 (-) Transcript_25894:1083-1388(-)